MSNLKDENERLRRELERIKHPQIQRARREAETVRLRREIEREKGIGRRIHRRRVEIRATGGYRGIASRAGMKLETKGRQQGGSYVKKAGKLLGKETKKFFSLHSNPHGFAKMLMNNHNMTDREKQKAFKTYIRNHGRRSSTIN